MGELNKNEVDEIINNSKDWLLSKARLLYSIDRDNFMLLIVVLAQYLYAICVKRKIADYNNGKYKVFGKTVGLLFNDSTKSDIAMTIVNARNKICHSFNSSECNFLVGIVIRNKDIVNTIIKETCSDKCLDDTLSKAINSMSCTL